MPQHYRSHLLHLGSLIAGLLFVMGFPTFASAHRSYVVKDRTLEGANGEKLIIERLFGDGIFMADPVRIQVRKTGRTIVAYTDTAPAVALFCPRISFCWAFTYGQVSLFPTGARLDLDLNDNPEAALPYPTELQAEEAKSFAKYLSDDSVRHVRSYAFGIPMFDSGSKNFSASSTASLIGPIIIIYNQIIPLSIVSGLSFLLFVVVRSRYRRYKLHPPRNPRATLFIQLITAAFAIALSGVILFAAFVFALQLPLPIFYLAAAAITGTELAKRFTRRAGNTNTEPVTKQP